MGVRRIIRRWLNEGVELPDRAYVDFVGAGVDVTDNAAANKTVVTIAATATTDGHIIQDETTDVTPQRARLAFRGAGVTAADTGTRTAVDIPGKAVEDEGSPVTYRDTINFAGAGVTVTDSASKTLVTIPATATINGHAIEDEGSALTQRATVDFRGTGVEAVDSGGKTVVRVRGTRPLLRKTKATNQSINNATATNLVFATTDHNLADAAGNTFDLPSTSLFSPPFDGLYLVTAQVEFDGSAASNRRLVVLYNDTDATNVQQISTPSIPSTGQSTHVLMALTVELLAAKDYAIRARQDSGGALNVNQGFTQMQVMYVGPSS